jgi:putative ATPase
VAAQQYPPDAVLPRTYYRPTRYGAESRLADLWDTLRSRIRRRP